MICPTGVYSTAEQLPADLLTTVGTRQPEQSVLMVDPSHFSVDYIINPHMRDKEGNPHVVDRLKAVDEHQELQGLYERLGYDVRLIQARADLPDMVFVANQSFPFVNDCGARSVLLSAMAHPERQGEVDLLEAYYRSEGYEIHRFTELPIGESMEGMGDVLWWPGKRLLVAGYGFRTSLGALRQVASIVAAPLVALELVDERYYHLDMALTFLGDETALWNPSAFSSASRYCLQELVPELLESQEDADRIGFSCNAHAPRTGEVLLDTGLKLTCDQLRSRGYDVHSVDVSEFHKAGGSVFCLKMMLP